MKKNWTLKFCLICMILSLMLVVSCGKKKIATDGAAATATDTAAPADDTAAAAGADTAVDEAATAGDETAGKEAGDAAAVISEIVDVYFDYDSSDILDSETAALEALAAWLNANPSATITIEGHCDERGTTEYNLALGDRRAARAKSYLEKLGVSSARLKTVSYGEEKPVVVGHDEDAWAKNRRAHFAK